MGHQPFEFWLLEENSLTASQKQELAAHLSGCPECQALHLSLAAATGLVATTPLVSPSPGFTDRWKVTLVQRRAVQHKRQTRLFFLSTIVGALVALGALIGVMALANISLPDLVVSGAKLLAGLINLAGDARFYIGTSLTGPLPVVIWILVSVGFCLLIFFWGYLLWRISLQGVQRDEKSH
jgi:hypothetical protein